MRNLILALSAASLAIPATMAFPTTQAEARKHHYKPRAYTGSDGRRYCRHSDGTTGLIAGGVGGALLGNSLAGSGDKTLGTALGGVAGAFGGRAIDRTMTADRRCR